MEYPKVIVFDNFTSDLPQMCISSNSSAQEIGEKLAKIFGFDLKDELDQKIEVASDSEESNSGADDEKDLAYL